jgi:hypothetical protein
MSPPQLPVLSATAPLTGIPTNALEIDQRYLLTTIKLDHLPECKTETGDTKLETEISHLAVYQGDNTR